MSADFWSGYVSGAIGILVGNPLDLVKTRIQAGSSPAPTANASSGVPQPQSFKGHFDRAGTLVRGTTAPLLTYGFLNALLFATYNRTLALLCSPSTPNPSNPHTPSLPAIYLAGATSGLTTFLISAPTELIKCRAQVASGPATSTSSWAIARDTWRTEGVRGLYYGGAITSVRDAVGYGFYFWAYEWSKRAISSPEDSDRETAIKVLLCGGLAGVVTWASIFPLDVVKTRVQTQVMHAEPAPVGAAVESRPLLQDGREREGARTSARLSTWAVAKHAYQTEGSKVFFRGLTICSVRAFVVNAFQWGSYELMMRFLQPQ